MSLANNFSKTCRICTCINNNGKSIYGREKFSKKSLVVKEVITACASVQIQKSDGLPEIICSKCLFYLRHAYTFKYLCEGSDYKLRNRIEQSRIQKQVDEEIYDLSLDDSETFIEKSNSKTVCGNEIKVRNYSIPDKSKKEHFDFVFVNTTVPSKGDILDSIYVSEATEFLNITDNNGGKILTTKKTLMQKRNSKKTPIKIGRQSHKLYKCDACNKQFRFKHLKQHRRSHMREKPFKCLICDQKFAFPSTLDHHRKVHSQVRCEELSSDCTLTEQHLEEKSLRYRKVSLSQNRKVKLNKQADIYNKKVVDQHRMLHTENKTFKSNKRKWHFVGSSALNRVGKAKKPVKCELCDMQFCVLSSLKRHIRTHTGEKPYKCNKCEMKFSLSTSLRRHTMIHTGEKPFKCEYCYRQFPDSFRLKNHRRLHTGEKPFKCDICGMRFIQRGSLKKHAVKHSGAKCNVCEMKFDGAVQLRRHVKTHGATPVKPFKCELCDAQFTVQCSLKRHIRIHTGEKPFTCEFCKRHFNDSSRLKRHTRIHTGEKPYECNTCGMQFIQSGSLKRHRMTHTGEKPFKCDICEQQFADSNDLKRHKWVHKAEKPYKCDMCDMQFIYSSSLKRHITVHTGEKPYKCDICEWQFTFSNDLKQHMMTHTGEKPFKCDICYRAFSRNSNLKKHKTIHMKEECYTCDMCKKVFPNHDALQKHLPIHVQYTLKCEKQFS